MTSSLRSFVLLGDGCAHLIEARPDWQGRWRLGRAIELALPAELGGADLAERLGRALGDWGSAALVECVWCLPPDILGVAHLPGGGGSAQGLSLPYPATDVHTRCILQTPRGSTWLWMHRSWLELLQTCEAKLGVQQSHVVPRAAFLDAYTRPFWRTAEATATANRGASAAAAAPHVLQDGDAAHVWLRPGVLLRSWSLPPHTPAADRAQRLALELQALSVQWPVGVQPTPYDGDAALARLLAAVADPRAPGPVASALDARSLYQSRLIGPPPQRQLQRWLHTAAVASVVAVLGTLGLAYTQQQAWSEQTQALRAELKSTLPEANAVQTLKPQLRDAQALVQAAEQAQLEAPSALATLGHVLAALPPGWTIARIQLSPQAVTLHVHAARAAQLVPQWQPAAPHPFSSPWERQGPAEPMPGTTRHQATYRISLGSRAAGPASP